MAILEERGIFWWNDQAVPTGQFAPNAAIGGKLTVQDNGSIKLELDARMPGEESALPNSDLPILIGIQGLLVEAGYALLLNVIRAGSSFRTHNVSTQSYISTYCLISKKVFKSGNAENYLYSEINVELAGFEDWMRLQSIVIIRKGRRLNLSYKQPKDQKFETDFEKIDLQFDLFGPIFAHSKYHNVNLREVARFKIKPRKAVSLEKCERYYQYLEELFIILTSSDRNLQWPSLAISRAEQRAMLYFNRNRTEVDAPKAHDCLINFGSIAGELGQIFSAYTKAREEYGPGIYLYLGTRRGVKMFVEHRFVNLIWGLEAFDRQSRIDGKPSRAFVEKIERIITQVSSKRDRRWLENKLKYAAEPNLAERLYDIFISLPLEFDRKALKNFCEECQTRRNEISHYGGIREKGQPYDEFMRDVDRKSNSLSALYHLKILSIIGIRPEYFNSDKNHNFPIYHMDLALRAAGLLVSKDSAQ